VDKWRRKVESKTCWREIYCLQALPLAKIIPLGGGRGRRSQGEKINLSNTKMQDRNLKKERGQLR
jgi:hypothetical protein